MTKKIKIHQSQNLSATDNGEVISTNNIHPKHAYTIRYKSGNTNVQGALTISFSGWQIQSALEKRNISIGSSDQEYELMVSLSSQIEIWCRLINGVSIEDCNVSDADMDLVKRAFNGCKSSLQKLEEDFMLYIGLSHERLVAEEHILECYDYSEHEDVEDLKRLQANARFSKKRLSKENDDHEELQLFGQMISSPAEDANLRV